MTERRPEDLIDEVVARLQLVNDPELGVDIYNLGLVYGIDITGEGDVTISYTLTSLACPVAPMIESQIREVVGDIEGVRDVDAELCIRPPWTRERMSASARTALGM